MTTESPRSGEGAPERPANRLWWCACRDAVAQSSLPFRVNGSRPPFQPACNRTDRHVPARNVTRTESERASAAPDDTHRHGTTQNDTNGRRHGVEQRPALIPRGSDAGSRVASGRAQLPLLLPGDQAAKRFVTRLSSEFTDSDRGRVATRLLRGGREIGKRGIGKASGVEAKGGRVLVLEPL